MAFDMRGELFGNRDELLREQYDGFLESLKPQTIEKFQADRVELAKEWLKKHEEA